MVGEERREEIPYFIYTVPPNVDPKTWADVQLKWVDAKLKEIEADKEKAKAFIELAREAMTHAKEYYLRKIPRATLPAYMLIGVVVVGAIILTLLDRVSGETFAFLMGTIVGYVISLLSKHV